MRDGEQDVVGDVFSELKAFMKWQPGLVTTLPCRKKE